MKGATNAQPRQSRRWRLRERLSLAVRSDIVVMDRFLVDVPTDVYVNIRLSNIAC
jgi:hypothetical protein